MVAVPLGEDRVRELLNDGLSIAAVNGRSQCVVAGERHRIDAFEERLRDEAVAYQRLLTGGAFHSALMAGVIEPLAVAARETRIGPPRIPYVSNVTGEWISEADVSDPQYWGRHARETVRFSASIDTLLTWGAAVFLEVGPGQVLSSLVRQYTKSRGGNAANVEAIASMPSAREAATDGECAVRALGRLWLAGVSPDWAAYHAGERRLRVVLPTYPFERKRYWADPNEQAADRPRSSKAAPLRAPLDDWFAIPSWSRSQLPASMDEHPARADRWLVLLGGSTPAGLLADRLARRGHDLVRVHAGSAFDRAADGDYTIDPASRSDYETLLAELRDSDRLPARVLTSVVSLVRPDRHDDVSRAPARRSGSTAGCIWHRPGATWHLPRR